MELNTATHGDLVRNAMILFQKGADSVDSSMRNSGLFKTMNVGKNTGNTREFSEFDLEEYASFKGESDQASRARVQQGYTKIATLYRIAKDIGISYEIRTQNKYPEVVNMLTSLGALAARRMDLDMSHRITFGSATSYVDLDGRTVDLTVGDGLALFSASHTLRASSTTYRNTLSGNAALSRSALESMESLCVEETYNHFGEKKALSFDILWTTDDPATVNVARELLRSTASTADDKNSGVVNVYQSKYRHVVLPRVATTATGAPDSAKATYWGLASSLATTAFLGMAEEPRLKTPKADQGEEFSTDDMNFGVRAGYFVTVVGANWIKFSEGDGS